MIMTYSGSVTNDIIIIAFLRENSPLNNKNVTIAKGIPMP
jgi:hypothetical protein